MKTRIPYLVAASVAALSVFYFNTTQGLSASPVVTVTSIDGQKFDLASTDGKARLVTFISPDCPISNRNIPNLQYTASRLENDSLDILSVAMPYDNSQDVALLKESENISYAMAHDQDGSINAAFPRVRFTPTTFLIDSNGQIVWRHVGRLEQTELDNKIDAHLLPRQLAEKQ